MRIAVTKNRVSVSGPDCRLDVGYEEQTDGDPAYIYVECAYSMIILPSHARKIAMKLLEFADRYDKEHCPIMCRIEKDNA